MVFWIIIRTKEAFQFEVPFETPVFNEFVVKFPAGFGATYKRMLDKNIVAGLPLENDYPEFPDHYLMCVTETMDKPDMDLLVEEVAS